MRYKLMLIIMVLALGTRANAPLNDNLFDSTQLLVKVSAGEIRGTIENNTCVWKGIRYAKAPIGNLRFRAPQPADKWQGVLDATQYGPIAPQLSRGLKSTETQSEDCLSLNIWSPAVYGKKRPVMVWIHGGGFVIGSGSHPMYNGAALATKGDVVVVTINYRLGAFGFLYFSDSQSDKGFENNLGIQDQVAALKWVKENIAQFGGDPNNVTIFGESAGAISVQTLLTIPSAKGLFAKAIAQSGPPQDLWTPQTAGMVTRRYLQKLGITNGNLSLLKTLPMDTLNKALQALMAEMKNEPQLTKTFAPTIDGTIIPTNLMAAVEKGKADNVPLLIGTNRDEANLFALKRIGMAPTNAKGLAPYLKKFSPEKRQQLFKVYKHYPHKKGVLALITDGIFTMPSVQFASLQSAHAPVYMYRFDWSSFPLKLIGLRSFHGLDLPFVFGTFNVGPAKKLATLASKKKIAMLSGNMQQAWINFAYTGNPNNKGTAGWKPYTASDRCTNIFDKKCRFVIDPYADRRKAWEGLSVFE